MGTNTVLRIKSAMNRRGTVEHIYMDNVYMFDSTDCVLIYDMNWLSSYNYSQLPPEYAGKELPHHWKALLEVVPPEKGTPSFKNIFISNVTGDNVRTFIYCIGFEKSIIDGVTLSNINVEAGNAGKVRYVKNFVVNDVWLKTADNSQISIETMQ